MSEHIDGYATKDSFAAFAGGRRRYVEREISGIGRVVLRSITAGEFARVDAARTRAALAGSGAKPKDREQVRALNDGYIELVIACVCGADKNPLFDAGDRAMLLALDTCVSDELIAACI